MLKGGQRVVFEGTRVFAGNKVCLWGMPGQLA